MCPNLRHSSRTTPVGPLRSHVSGKGDDVISCRRRSCAQDSQRHSVTRRPLELADDVADDRQLARVSCGARWGASRGLEEWAPRNLAISFNEEPGHSPFLHDLPGGKHKRKCFESCHTLHQLPYTNIKRMQHLALSCIQSFEKKIT